MSAPDYIDISSDEETEIKDVKDVKPIVLFTQACYRIANNQALCKDYPIIQGVKEENGLTIVNENLYGSCMTERVRSSTDEFCSPPALLGSSLPLCRQFWKSGDYEAGKALQPPSQNGKNRLRIHPRFLHSNATSHKWAFGAVAELLDNALDEVQNGATFVIIDEFINPRNRDSALLVQDDGGGMDPNSLRRCMSFGFSDKQSDVSIGQYGNGFKTSTMRLGADVIVFSRCMNNRVLTQSVGLLSYTFLRQTGSDDIVVPVVDYGLNSSTGAFGRLVRTDQKQFASNLYTLLKWSPFASESELLKQFNDIGHHGTKVIVFNLWYNDDGVTELDFESDATDIRINGERKKLSHGCDIELTERYVATQLQYSLRAYASILYLHIPGAFKILLRGQVVMPHNVVHDLIYRECIQYKPQVDGNLEAVVLTTLGFLNGAPRIDVQGFNVYHKNRLILPFWRVTTNSYGKGRGVVGVLEANFIKPTHDKQDFEKSTVYQKLENRLKEMTYEYWDYHCHLIGYKSKLPPSKLASAPAPVDQLPPLRTYNAARHAYRSHGAASIAGAPQSQVISTPSGQTYNSKAQTGIPQKRKLESLVSATEPLGKQAIKVSNHKIQPEHNGVQKQSQEIETMMQENKKLQEQCLAYEEAGKLLMLKEARLRRELQEVQQTNKNLLAELRSLDEIKVEKS